MTIKGEFKIEGSLKITGRGLVIYGDILDGTVAKDNFIYFNNGHQEIKLKIKGVDFLDKIAERISKIGLTFYYDNKQQMMSMETMELTHQKAKITED